MKLHVEDKVYDFDETSVDNQEFIALETEIGMTVGEWSEALARGSLTAITALIWILRRREGESELAFKDVSFKVSSLSIEDVPEPEGKEG